MLDVLCWLDKQEVKTITGTSGTRLSDASDLLRYTFGCAPCIIIAVRGLKERDQLTRIFLQLLADRLGDEVARRILFKGRFIRFVSEPCQAIGLNPIMVEPSPQLFEFDGFNDFCKHRELMLLLNSRLSSRIPWNVRNEVLLQASGTYWMKTHRAYLTRLVSKSSL